MGKKLGIVLFVLAVAMAKAQSPMYIVSDFAEDDLEVMLHVCDEAGIGQLLQRHPFITFGHYEWDPKFAKNGDKSVARMVREAASQGIRLGVFTYQDAISLNDPYFTPPYFKRLQRQGRVTLFDDLVPEQRDFALRMSESMKAPSSLNLLLIDDELVSYGTMEPARGLLLLHGCDRGTHGTQAVGHAVTAEAYKIWDSPQRFVAPDDELRDSVRQNLMDRIEVSGMPYVLYGGGPGQLVLEESVRVRQVERWANDEASLKAGGLGWFVIHPSDQKRASTTMEEVEWMLSKVAGFDTGCGWVIDKITVNEHAGLETMLQKIRQWERLRSSGALTQTQRELLKDPYMDWHLEQLEDTLYQLFPLHISRRYRCSFMETDTGIFTSEPMEWRSEQDDRFGLRIQVEGKREIVNPMVNTEKGLVFFPCVIQPGQCLVYDFEDVAKVVDANFNPILEVVPEGLSKLPEGVSEATLIIEMEPDGPLPDVTIRYLIRERPATILLTNEDAEP